jgi:cyclophilin family peptidyl-prolyl cis-trans isomerase
LCAKLDPESNESQFYMAKTMLDMLDVPYFVNRIKACPSLEEPHAQDESLLDIHFEKCREASEKAIMFD